MTTARIDLPQGTLDLLILRTLALEPQHGWAISERIRQVSTEVLGPVAADSWRMLTAAVGQILDATWLRT